MRTAHINIVIWMYLILTRILYSLGLFYQKWKRISIGWTNHAGRLWSFITEPNPSGSIISKSSPVRTSKAVVQSPKREFSPLQLTKAVMQSPKQDSSLLRLTKAVTQSPKRSSSGSIGSAMSRIPMARGETICLQKNIAWVFTWHG